jgi:beta-aspartyl-peptidase (threonine type)
MHALLIHGGAGRIGTDRRDAYRAGLSAALDAGFAVLEAGGEALDAACAAVARMENDDRAFNAGTGSALTRAGTVECDAAVMLSDGRAGAVACVTRSRNPVRLARRVMETTPHVLMVGPGAEALEPEPIDPAALITPASRAALRRWQARHASPEGSATCGAVALDAEGRLAAATSTGGVLGQLPGRVGDAPIPGAGTWADRRVAISCTGRGEAFLRAATARALADDVAAGVAPIAAIEARLAEVRGLDGEGGLIAVTGDGRILIGYDTPQMAWGWRRRGDGAVGGDGASVTAVEGGWQVGDAAEVREIAASPRA